jgi:hypothetical protein
MAEWAVESWNWIKSTVVPWTTIHLGHWWGEFKGWWEEHWPTWQKNMKDWTAASWEWLRDDVVPNVKTQLGEWAAQFGDPSTSGGKIVEWFETKYPNATARMLLAMETFTARYNSLVAAIMLENEKMGGSFEGLGQFLGEYFQAWIGVFRGLRDVLVTVFSLLISDALKKVEQLMGIVEVMVRVVKGDWQGALDAWRRIDAATNAALPENFKVQSAVDALNEAINKALDVHMKGSPGLGATTTPGAQSNVTNNFTIYMSGTGGTNEIGSTIAYLQALYA